MAQARGLAGSITLGVPRGRLAPTLGQERTMTCFKKIQFYLRCLSLLFMAMAIYSFMLMPPVCMARVVPVEASNSLIKDLQLSHKCNCDACGNMICEYSYCSGSLRNMVGFDRFYRIQTTCFLFFASASMLVLSFKKPQQVAEPDREHVAQGGE